MYSVPFTSTAFPETCSCACFPLPVTPQCGAVVVSFGASRPGEFRRVIQAKYLDLALRPYRNPSRKRSSVSLSISYHNTTQTSPLSSSARCFFFVFYLNIPPPIPPPCLCAASPCIFSETLMLTSKNLATQRSRQTDSPLFRSASRYSAGMHFFVQVSTSLEYIVSGACLSEMVGVMSVLVEHVGDHFDLGFGCGDLFR